MRARFLALTLLAAPAVGACTESPERLVLRGTVVTPNRVLRNGTVVVDGDRIRAVADRPIDVPGARVVPTSGIIFPGLIDLHNHIEWNVFPRWSPPRRYPNRHAWLDAPAYRSAISEPHRVLHQKHACDMNTFGEVRALLGGVTSVQSGGRGACASGLIRTLNDNGGLPGPADGALETLLDVESLSPNRARRLARELRDGTVPALVVHLGEARADDPLARDEFATLVRYGLLTERTVIVHGTGLGDAEFQAMQESGAALVWSPRSNMELYGETASIAMALDRGIPIALAPDWAISGSSNMLDELRYAQNWSREQFGAPLEDEQLVRMVTSVPAAIARIDDKVGSIREGLYADLLVVRGDPSRPYSALVHARPADVELVIVGGRPVYGTPAVMREAVGRWDYEELEVCGARMAIDVTRDGGSLLDSRYRFKAVERRLREAMAALTPSTLAPIAECP